MTKSKSLTTFAAGVLKRFGAVETEANRIHGQEAGATFMRAVLDDNGLHVLATDQHGTTLEIAGGKLAVSVKSEAEQ